MEASQRYGIIEAVIHLVNRDFVALADLYKRLGFIPQEQVRLIRKHCFDRCGGGEVTIVEITTLNL